LKFRFLQLKLQCFILQWA